MGLRLILPITRSYRSRFEPERNGISSKSVIFFLSEHQVTQMRTIGTEAQVQRCVETVAFAWRFGTLDRRSGSSSTSRRSFHPDLRIFLFRSDKLVTR